MYLKKAKGRIMETQIYYFTMQKILIFKKLKNKKKSSKRKKPKSFQILLLLLLYNNSCNYTLKFQSTQPKKKNHLSKILI
jgi:hypothetical protein